MRAFGTGSRLAEVEARITAEMTAASAEGWTITHVAGIGSGPARQCCALGAVARDIFPTYRPTPRAMATLPNAGNVAQQRLGLTPDEYANIAGGFDGDYYTPDTNEWVAMGRRLKAVGDNLNARRAA